MGKFSNYAAVYANLVIDGEAKGVLPFMVQIRHSETFEPLPSVETGDIGPKFGYNSKDNGYMMLRNVHIPRTNMLKRFVEVDKEGNLDLKGDLRIIYCIMLETRCFISQHSAIALA